MQMHKIWRFVIKNLRELGGGQRVGSAIELNQVGHRVRDGVTPDTQTVNDVGAIRLVWCGHHGLDTQCLQIVRQIPDVHLRSAHRVRRETKWNLNNLHFITVSASGPANPSEAAVLARTFPRTPYSACTSSQYSRFGSATYASAAPARRGCSAAWWARTRAKADA